MDVVRFFECDDGDLVLEFLGDPLGISKVMLELEAAASTLIDSARYGGFG